jgi:peroxiredoxin
MQTIGSIDIGQVAPDFTLKGPGGQPFTLSEYRGRKNVVLVFFPLAFSPMCAHQLPQVQKESTRFDNLDAVVFGISVDSHHANDAFAKKLGLTFPLLSDFGREVSSAYGVLNASRGTSGRALFVIDKQGRVIHKDVSANSGDIAQMPSAERALEALRHPGA